MGLIDRNQPFTCEVCGKAVESADETCRNHCPYCLWSKHVDEFIPGDRESMCQGLMRPIKLEKEGEEFIIIHRCTKCGKEMRNKAVPDDNLDVLLDPKK